MNRTIVIAASSLVFMLAFIFLCSSFIHQQKYEHEITILIDRPPMGLLPGQALDVGGKRFAPLLERYEVAAESTLEQVHLLPKNKEWGLPNLKFQVVRDESTRALKFLRGDADVLYDTLSIVKTEWLKSVTDNKELRIYQQPGLNLSYLGYSHRNPILKKIEVRRAIAQALPVHEWAKYKLMGWADPATDFIKIQFDPQVAEQALDGAGYPKDPHGVRFKLRYFTTGIREGGETALLVQESLKKIGIEVEVITLDTLLVFQKFKKGDSDLFSSRWFRFDENESIAEYLKTGGFRNYLSYSNPELDLRLNKNPVLSKNELQQLLQKDLPFYPLYTWRHGLILSPRIAVHDEKTLIANLDETFRFLLLIGLK